MTPVLVRLVCAKKTGTGEMPMDPAALGYRGRGYREPGAGGSATERRRSGTVAGAPHWDRSVYTASCKRSSASSNLFRSSS
jgi:hypothetical protein